VPCWCLKTDARSTTTFRKFGRQKFADLSPVFGNCGWNCFGSQVSQSGRAHLLIG
jgi:hypothetical protein